MELMLKEMAHLSSGKILQGSPDLRFSHYNFDSRQTRSGEVFFALKGQRDGHQFVIDAWKKGATAAVVSQPIDGLPPSFGLLMVDDTLKALQTIAYQVLLSAQAKVVAITGSVGKTTTKEITAALLATRYRVIKSEKNYNNEIGLPLTLLRLSPLDEIAVLEMAMRGPGEIKRLTEIAPPDVAVITGIHPVHLEFFPSIEGIARAKQEILLGTKNEGTAVLNNDDPLVRKIATAWKGKSLFYGFSPESQVRAISISRLDFKGLLIDLQIGQNRFQVKSPFLYEGLVYNLLAAFSVAHLFSIPPEVMAAVAEVSFPSPGRGELIFLKPEIHLIDDTYNSNPYALEEALRSLSTLPAQRRLAVLGDMLELGPDSPLFHREIGQKLVHLGWDYLLTVGPLSKEMASGAKEAGLKEEKIFCFNEPIKAAYALDSILEPGDLVLIKGSRAMNLERIVEYLKARRGGQ